MSSIEFWLGLGRCAERLFERLSFWLGVANVSRDIAEVESRRMVAPMDFAHIPHLIPEHS